MRPYRCPFAFALHAVVLLFSLVGFAGTPTVATTGPVLPSNTPAAKRGFDFFYNMEYDKAIHEFETLQKEIPNDPFVTNYLLSTVLFKELYRIGALDTESYAADSFLDQKARRPVDPKAKQRILELATQAAMQSEKQLAGNPNNVDALYARGVTRSLRSTYMGMAEKAWLSAIRAALGARRDHDRVLELDRNYAAAKTAVGVHNYIVGSLSWPMKVAASLIGVSGNRQKGLQLLRESAGADTISSMDAKIALALFLRREQKYAEALELVRGMVTAYPRNFLVAIEFANLENAAGHGPDAIASYRGILESYKQKKYALAEPELAAYGLGVSLRGQRRFDEAAEAFASVGKYPNIDKELAQRAALDSGEMYDTLKQREPAVKKYQEAIVFDSKSDLADTARKHIKQPYQFR